MTFKELCKELEDQILEAYESGVTMETAERLAARFLYAQLKVSEELKIRSLDAKMRKSGLKAIKAAIRLEIVNKSDKKPTVADLDAMIDSDEIVTGEQNALDLAEVDTEELERIFGVFSNGHVFMRTVSKGSYGV
jgi:hypothetical protein